MKAPIDLKSGDTIEFHALRDKIISVKRDGITIYEEVEMTEIERMNGDIEILKARIAALEARPQIVFYPPVTYPPFTNPVNPNQPISPWYQVTSVSAK